MVGSNKVYYTIGKLDLFCRFNTFNDMINDDLSTFFRANIIVWRNTTPLVFAKKKQDYWFSLYHGTEPLLGSAMHLLQLHLQQIPQG